MESFAARAAVLALARAAADAGAQLRCLVVRAAFQAFDFPEFFPVIAVDGLAGPSLSFLSGERLVRAFIEV